MALTLKAKTPKNNAVLKLRSFSDPDKWYVVDRDLKTCTCGQFADKGYCKHLEAVGVYQDKKWNEVPRPTFSQALSGLVKSLRIRSTQDAIYWMTYLDTFKNTDKGSRFRVARRLLIGSSEDGHSVAVMERVAKNFPHLCQEDTHLIELCAEAVRICKVPNWWNDITGGHDYIRRGMITNRQARFYGEGGDGVDTSKKLLVDSIEDKDRTNAMLALERILGVGEISRTKLANYLMELAVAVDNEPAKRLIAIHLSAKSPLSGDANFLFQSVWWMAGGVSPVVDSIEKVMASEVKGYMAAAIRLWKNPNNIPAWCCDGVHCSGTDRRFAGMWPDMYAACNVFARTGDVDPSIQWLREDYSLEGLIYV